MSGPTLNFPSSPALNDTYSFGGKTWTYNGSAWKLNIVSLTTSIVTEGTNLYFTNARSRASISVAGSGTYDNTTGVITVTGGVTSVGGATGTVSNAQIASAVSSSGILTTSNVAEGTSLYFTTARARASLDGINGIAYGNTTGNISLTTTGVTANTYGGGTKVPVITVDSYGRLTSASNVTISNGFNIYGNVGVIAVGTDGAGSTSLIGGAGISSTASGASVTFDLTASGVSATTYGGTTQIPVLTVDTYGRVTSASNVTLTSGVSSVNGRTGAVTGLAETANGLSQFASTSSSELAGVISDETGSGALVFATSPVLVTPNIGSPSYAVLTNATGLPVLTGISGFGTGVATFLGQEPTSANLATLITDETGTGKLVFGTSPAITTSVTTPSTSFDLVNTTATTVNFAGDGTTVNIGGTTGNTNIRNSMVISGNLLVQGTTTTVSSTTLDVADKNVTLAKGAGNSAGADGAGITIDGAGATLNYVHASTAWTSSQDVDLASGKVYKVNNAQVLSATALGTSVVTSNLTSVGTIATGVWNGTEIGTTYTAAKVTAVNGRTGAVTGLAETANGLSQFASTSSSQLAGVISDETGSGNVVFSNSPVLVTPNIGTPSYAVLTSATGLPISTGVSGLGANQTTLLAADAQSGVVATTYGSTLNIPVIVVDVYGRITSASNVAITSGVSSVGGATGAVSNIQIASAAISSGILTTANVSELTNLYFTNARSRASVSAGTGISYDTANGVISSTITQYADANARVSLSITGTKGSYSNTTGVFNLTNIANVTVSANVPGSPNIGDVWFDDATGSEYLYFNDGSSSQWVEQSSGTTVSSIVESVGGVTGAVSNAQIASALTGQNLVNVSSISVTGNVTAAGYVTASDKRLKKSIKTVSSALNTVGALRGVTFTWKDTNIKAIGMIAQEVEEVLPDIVTTDDDGYRGVRYTEVIGVLVEAIKELKADFEEYKKTHP